jgi:TonB family protein
MKKIVTISIAFWVLSIHILSGQIQERKTSNSNKKSHSTIKSNSSLKKGLTQEPISESIERSYISEIATYPMRNSLFYEKISQEVQMPEEAKKKGIEGEVKLSFTVGIDGVLSSFKIEKSLGFGCDEEAIRVVKSLGKWNPSKSDGKPVSSLKSVLVAFGQMQRDEDNQPVEVIRMEEKKRFSPPLGEEDVFNAVEQNAEFIGGRNAFEAYVNENLKYPEQAKRDGISGKVYIQFVINIDGSMQNPRIVKGLCSGCDEEAMRLIKSIPKWIPGKQDKQIVRSLFTSVILFKLP